MSSRIVSLPVLGRARDIFGRVQASETGSSAGGPWRSVRAVLGAPTEKALVWLEEVQEPRISRNLPGKRWQNCQILQIDAS